MTRPLVWIGSQCRIVSDAMEGTRYGETRDCDYCGSECEETAVDAADFEVAEEEELPPEISDWEVEAEHSMREESRRLLS